MRNEDKQAPVAGDRVQFAWQDRLMRGVVDAVDTEGDVTDSAGETTMTATPEAPVYQVRVLDADGEPTEDVVLRLADGLVVDVPAMADDEEAETDTAMADEDPDNADVDERPNPVKAALLFARSLLPHRRAPDPTGLKVVGNRWVAVWSNNFEDRDREVFTEKAHDDYVARVDAGLTPPPELWVWHIPGTRIGAAEWVGRHGHFMLAGGTFDNTPTGRKAAAYYANAPETALSHGFTYPADGFDGVAYRAYNTFEISLLPRGQEANRFTTLKGVLDMGLSAEKRLHLEKVFGKEAAAAMLADLETAGKALAEAGVAYKDFATTGNGDETAAVREAAKAIDTSVGLIVADLLEGHAEVATGQAAVTKEVAGHSKRLLALEAAVKMLADVLDERPRRATNDPATLEAADSPVAERVRTNIKQQSTQTHNFWGTTVSEEDGNV